MDQDTVLGLIRHALTSAGGFLVADGLATSSQVSDAAGAIVILLGLAWSIWNKRQHKAALQANADKFSASLPQAGARGGQ